MSHWYDLRDGSDQEDDEFDYIKYLVQKFMSTTLSTWPYYGRRRPDESKTSKDPTKIGPCRHTRWDLYFEPCAKCKRICNCLGPQHNGRGPFMDLVVMTLDKKIRVVPKEVVQASNVLSLEVDQLLKRNQGVEKVISDDEICHMGDIVKVANENVMIFFDQETNEPSVSLTADVLKKLELYFKTHFEKAKQRAEELKQRRGILIRENDPKKMNKLAYEDWECEFFDSGQQDMLDLLQANLELLCWDLHVALHKFVIVNTGIPLEEARALAQDEVTSLRRMCKYNTDIVREKTYTARGRFLRAPPPRVSKTSKPNPKEIPNLCSDNTTVHSEWKLYLRPCIQCMRFCNCRYNHFPESYPDVLVRTLDKKLLWLPGEFVRASVTLSTMVDEALKQKETRFLTDPPVRLDLDGLDLDFIEYPGKKLLILFDEKGTPTLGIKQAVLKKVRYFVKMHLEEVDEKVEAQKRFEFYSNEVLWKRKLVMDFEATQINTFAYEDWEKKFFKDMSISLFLELRQANVELQITDFRWALEKWVMFFRGTPVPMVNGHYDIFEDPEFDERDRQNIYGLYNVEYYNPYRIRRPRRRRKKYFNYTFEFKISGPGT